MALDWARTMFPALPTPSATVDAVLTPFGLSFIGLVVAFHILAPFFPNTKQSSWILSVISSFTMSAVSLPYLWDYLVNGASLEQVRSHPELALVSNRFFQAYLICDLMIGLIYYRSRISLLAGWIHHPLYVVIVELVIRQSWSDLFCLAAAMEIPTFVLGISTIFPRVRSNVLFAVTFFMTRILFHVVLGITLLFKNNRAAVTGGSYIPSMMLAGILPLHVSWFVGCIKGFFRRARQSTPPASAGDIASSPSPAPSATRPTKSPSEVSFFPSAPPRPFRLRLSHRRQSFERALRSFRYDFLESPTSKRTLISNAVSAYIPRRETLYEWVGLGQKRRRRFVTGGIGFSTATETVSVTAG